MASEIAPAAMSEDYEWLTAIAKKLNENMELCMLSYRSRWTSAPLGGDDRNG